jgi:hypothetical protein
MLICSVENCSLEAKTAGLCSTHYQRKKRLGDANAPLKIARKYDGRKCIADGCDREAKKSNLCTKHYHRLRRLGVLETGRPDRLPNLSQIKCSVQGCKNNAIALNLCSKHYSKLKKHGDPLAGGIQDGRSKVWHVRDIGYVMRFDRTDPHAGKNGIVYQHRQVMGEHIGRPLRKDENVHHKNGNRADNRIENLELWSKSQPAGQRVADKVKWAKEILAEYGHLDIL